MWGVQAPEMLESKLLSGLAKGENVASQQGPATPPPHFVKSLLSHFVKLLWRACLHTLLRHSEETLQEFSGFSVGVAAPISKKEHLTRC